MNHTLFKWIPLQTICKGIIIYFIFTFAGCDQINNDQQANSTLIWKNNRATGLSILKNKLANIHEDSIPQQVKIRLVKDVEQPVIPGEYLVKKNEIIFEPLLPFTRGLTYGVYVRGKLFDKIEIPKDTSVPLLLAIYPGSDSLPENLLKIYLVFSHPMLEGHSMDYITLLDDKGDSLTNTFLHLQSELWNEEGNILSLWLDPGRIKRDLQPNKQFGPPLLKNRHYTLLIHPQWPDNQGSPLGQSYSKKFVAVERDTVSPNPDQWSLNIPTKDKKEPIIVHTNELLDYMLLINSITVIDSAGNLINGKIISTDQETGFLFTPEKPWESGVYILQVESRLADLAGNNLNRLFDVDLQSRKSVKSAPSMYTKSWRIE